MDKDELWNQALSLLLQNVSEDDPKNFFLNQLRPVGIFGSLLVLQAQSAEVEEWVKKMYLAEIEAAVEQASGISFEIGIGSTTTTPVETPAATPAPTFQPPSYTPVVPPQVQQQPQAAPQPDFLNTYVTPSEIRNNNRTVAPAKQKEEKSGNESLFAKCTFDTFIVGKANEFARNASLAVAEQPGVAYNPLFIYGNSGLGKTHLLVAIANYTMQNFPAMITRYVAASRFFDDYMSATRNHDFSSFNEKYNHVDILLVDDVQYLVAKHSDSLLETFFNIFNDMTNQSKQIVLSADRAPQVLEMDRRLTSRFSSDLVVDIKPPDYETRLAILKNFYSRMNQVTPFYGVIPDDVFSYLAEVSTSNIREMEGAMTRLTSNMSLVKRDSITVEEAQDLLKDFFPDNDNRQIDISTIQSVVERYFSISHEDLISPTRRRGITTARHIAIYLSRWLTEESLETIGKKFGGRDHTTVMHSVSKIEREQKDNKKLFDQIEELTLRIKELN